MTVYTIGHSTRTLDELVDALRGHGVEVLADVRRFPRSRHTPQFDADVLEKELPERGLRYAHLRRLGGRRSTRSDSPNTGWRNKSFRGYADHMQTEEFAAGLAALLDLVDGGPTAIMCAEAVPWRCHRSLIGDALLTRDLDVVDIFDATKAEPHRLTSFAVVSGHTVTYPGNPDSPESSSST